MTWSDAGAAWGARAAEWAALIDPWSMPVYLDVFDRLKIGDGERVLDIACGSALAGVELRRRGAVPSGLDASAELISIVRRVATFASVTSSSCRGAIGSSTW